MDSLNDRNQGLCLHAEAVMPLIRERLAAGQNVKNLGFQGVSMMPMLRQGKDSVELAPLPQKLRKYDLPVYRNAAGKYVPVIRLRFKSLQIFQMHVPAGITSLFTRIQHNLAGLP